MSDRIGASNCRCRIDDGGARCFSKRNRVAKCEDASRPAKSEGDWSPRHLAPGAFVNRQGSGNDGAFRCPDVSPCRRRLRGATCSRKRVTMWIKSKSASCDSGHSAFVSPRARNWRQAISWQLRGALVVARVFSTDHVERSGAFRAARMPARILRLPVASSLQRHPSWRSPPCRPATGISARR